MGIRISSTTGSKIIGAMVKAKGEEFVKKLREQQIKLYSIDAPALEWVPMGLVPNNVGGGRFEPAASSCRGLDGGSALGSGRTEGSGKILLW